MVKKGKKSTKAFFITHIPILDKLRYNLHFINTHPIFIGLMMITLNIISKHITLKLSKSQEQYIKNTLGRQFLIFAIMWSGTRDIVYALLLTGAFVTMADHLFNEESRFCIIPESLRNYAHLIDTNDDGVISNEEAEHAIHVLEKLKQQKKKQAFLKNNNIFSSSVV